MRALALASFDVPAAMMDVLEPVAGPGEVLVRVRAASVNAYDLGVAAGFMKDYLPYEFPAVIGNDVAGTIEALGDGVDGFSIGDRVFGTMGSKPAIHDGGFAELAFGGELPPPRATRPVLSALARARLLRACGVIMRKLCS